VELREQLLRARKARGLSQEELALQVGVSRQAVSKWETGDALPDLPKLLALADALHMSIDALCGREAADTAPPEGYTVSDSPRRRRYLAGILAGLLLLCLSFFAGMQVSGNRALEDPPLPELPDVVDVSGVNFFVVSEGLSYQFVPSVAGEGYTYQITFKDVDGPALTFDAPYTGGLCADTVPLEEYWSYSVTVVISNGQNSRAVPLASQLSFGRNPNAATWSPVAD